MTTKPENEKADMDEKIAALLAAGKSITSKWQKRSAAERRAAKTGGTCLQLPYDFDGNYRWYVVSA